MATEHPKVDASEQTIVELDGITKQFGDVTAVADIDLCVRQGELLTLLGPSGCGKTTTLRMIAGFESPTTGDIAIAGEPVTERPAYNRDTGMVFQHYALFPHMTVADNIGFGLRMQGVADDEVKERVADALSMVRLAGIGDRYPSELSGGQQQRVALARALIIEPTVLLLDEPLSDLDKKLREEMRFEILRLHQELDITMIYVTHNQEEALTISDRMAVMSDGEIRQVGSPTEIYQEPNDEFVADFIGNTNLLEGTVTEITPSTIRVDFPFNGTYELESVTADQTTVQPGEELTVLIRPEHFSIHAATEQDARENTLNGEIKQATYLGSRFDYFVDTKGGEIHVVQQNIEREAGFQPGDRVELSFNRDIPFVIPTSNT